MAGPLPCDNHPDIIAVFLCTDLQNGNTLTLCQPCFLDFCGMILGPPEEPIRALGGETAVAEEVADLEPETPTPDADLKRKVQEGAAKAAAADYRSPAAQETETPGD